MSNIKKRDDEKLMTIAVCGIFSAVLLIILFTAGNLFHMGVLLSMLTIVAIAACAHSWYKVISHMYDPNMDYWRWLCILFAIAAIVIILGHRSAWLERKQVLIDSQTEQPAP